MVQHLRCEFWRARLFGIGCKFRLQIVCIFSCDKRGWLLVPPTSLSLITITISIIDLIHSLIIDVISIFNSQPWILLDVLTILSRLKVNYIELRRLLVMNFTLIELQTFLPVTRQVRILLSTYVFDWRIMSWHLYLVVLRSIVISRWCLIIILLASWLMIVVISWITLFLIAFALCTISSIEESQ